MGKPKGGARPGAGRPPGRANIATTEDKRGIAEIAREHSPVAMAALVSIARSSQSDAAKVSAASVILDRAYGKVPASIEHTGKNGGPIDVSQVSEFEAVRRIAFAIELAKRGNAGS